MVNRGKARHEKMLEQEMERLSGEGFRCIVLQHKIPDAIIIDWKKREIHALEVYTKYNDLLMEFSEEPYKALGYDSVFLKTLGDRPKIPPPAPSKKEQLNLVKEFVFDTSEKYGFKETCRRLKEEKEISVSRPTLSDFIIGAGLNIKSIEVPLDLKRVQLQFRGSSGTLRIHLVDLQDNERTFCGFRLTDAWKEVSAKVNCLKCLELFERTSTLLDLRV